MSGISAHIKDPQRALLTPPSCVDTMRRLKPRRELPDHAGTLISDFKPLGL